jgi:putative transposase
MTGLLVQPRPERLQERHRGPLPPGTAPVGRLYSRHVLSWRLSNTLEGGFCPEALDDALGRGRPEIFNTDQGSQFTSREYTGRLEGAGIAVSRDGRGRALDNVFVERLRRCVKYEDIDIKDYERVCELETGLTAYFRFDDEDRPHQPLGYRTPGEVDRAGVRIRQSGGGP